MNIPHIFTYAPTFYDLAVSKICVFPVDEHDHEACSSFINDLNHHCSSPILLESDCSLRLHFIPRIVVPTNSSPLHPGFFPILYVAYSTLPTRPPSPSLIKGISSSLPSSSILAFIYPSTSNQYFLYDCLPSISSSCSSPCSISSVITRLSSLIFRSLPHQPPPLPSNTKKETLSKLFYSAGSNLVLGRFRQAKSLFSAVLDASRALNDSFSAALSFESLVTCLLYLSLDNNEPFTYSLVEPFILAAVGEFSRCLMNYALCGFCIRICSLVSALPSSCFDDVLVTAGQTIGSKYVSKSLEIMDLLEKKDQVALCFSFACVYGFKQVINQKNIGDVSTLFTTWTVSKYPLSFDLKQPFERKSALLLKKASTLLIELKEFKLASELINLLSDYYNVDQFFLCQKEKQFCIRKLRKWKELSVGLLESINQLSIGDGSTKVKQSVTSLIGQLIALHTYNSDLTRHYFDRLVSLSLSVSSTTSSLTLPIFQSIDPLQMHLFSNSIETERDSEQNSPFIVKSKAMTASKLTEKPKFITWSSHHKGRINVVMKNPFSYDLGLDELFLYLTHVNEGKFSEVILTHPGMSLNRHSKASVTFSVPGQNIGELTIESIGFRLNNIILKGDVKVFVPDCISSIKLIEVPCMSLSLTDDNSLIVTNSSLGLEIDEKFSISLSIRPLKNVNPESKSKLNELNEHLFTEIINLFPLKPKSKRFIYMPTFDFEFSISIILVDKKSLKSLSTSNLFVPARETGKSITPNICLVKEIPGDNWLVVVKNSSNFDLEVFQLGRWESIGAGKFGSILVKNRFPYLKYKYSNKIEGQLSLLLTSSKTSQDFWTDCGPFLTVERDVLTKFKVFLRKSAIVTFSVDESQRNLIGFDGLMTRHVEVSNDEVVDLSMGVISFNSSRVIINIFAEFGDGTSSTIDVVTLSQ
ncbi:hypothetical protein P9112_013031 [Eukaryota sp. TZLM1-RC]